MVISVRVPDEDGDRVKGYAVYKGISVSELLRDAMLEHLDNECQLSPQEWDMVREKIAYAEKQRKKKKKKKRQKEMQQKAEESQTI